MAAEAPDEQQEPTLQERLAEAEAKAARLEGENAALRTPVPAPPAPAAPAPPPKVFTRTELQARVDAGEIAETEIDGILDRQSEAKARRIAQEEAARVRDEVTVTTELSAYQAARPELADPDSNLRKEVLAKFTMLRSLGDPDDAVTELKAYKAVMGDTVPKAATITPARRPTTQEGSSGDNAPGHRAPKPGAAELDSDGFPVSLKPHIKKHYQKQIEQGAYSGPSDERLQREIAYAEGGAKGDRDSRTRRQNTARAQRTRQVSA